MATLLLWLSWRDREPEPAVWASLLERARSRSRFGGCERSGSGYRLYAARTRDAEPSVLLQRRFADSVDEILLLDRANGAEDAAVRDEMDWSDARLADGTPTASIRLWPSQSRVQLYRDLMGQRPLVYARLPGGLLVASGEDVLRAHPRVSDELDQMYLAAYFAGLSPAPDETAFRDIRGLGSGETLIIDGSDTRRTKQKLEPDDSWRRMHDQEIVERFGELLRHSVSTACLGAQRIGISLSAGLDSSSIAAIAKRLPLARTDAIFGVTQGVDQFPDIDERALVGALAREIGIQHLSFSADRLLPYADAELHPVCPDSPSQSPFREWKEASAQMISAAGAEVYLSGDFADGLFSGGVEWVVDALRFQRWRLLGQQLTQQLRAQGLRATLADTAVRRPMSRALGRVAPHSERLDWLKRNYRDAIAERLRHEARAYSDFPRAQHCAQLLGAGAALDASAEHWFANRHGLEQRLPYRDLALTRWCLSLPADFFARNGQSKWLLRQSVCGLLPENLRLRRKSSDLTPVFEQAIKTQATTLAALCAAAGPIPGHYVRASAMQNLDPGYRTIASWLVSSFGSWLQSIDAKAASCATAVHTCPLTDDSLDGLLKGDR